MRTRPPGSRPGALQGQASLAKKEVALEQLLLMAKSMEDQIELERVILQEGVGWRGRKGKRRRRGGKKEGEGGEWVEGVAWDSLFPRGPLCPLAHDQGAPEICGARGRWALANSGGQHPVQIRDGGSHRIYRDRIWGQAPS